MNRRQRCPECKQWLEVDLQECYCGWISVFSGKNYAPDHQCVFALSGLRCPLDGANCPSTRGSGPWYCLGHLRSLSNPQRSKEILMDAFENFETLMDERIDWRVKIIPEDYAIRKVMINELAKTAVLNFRRRISNEK